ncbi:hypothetical protein OAG60_02450 [bacterium]|nr:hypothetical protein [bacterium]
MPEPFITMPNGEQVPCCDLIDLSQAARIAGVARQTVTTWADGLGKGRGVPLRTVLIGSVPFTTEAWLEALESRQRTASTDEVDKLKQRIAELEAKVSKRRNLRAKTAKQAK